MNSDTAFVIPVFTHTVDNWSDYKEEIIDMLDTGDGDGHKTDYFKYHQEGKLHHMLISYLTYYNPH